MNKEAKGLLLNYGDKVNIAETILEQIQYPNKMVYFSWGAHKFTRLPDGYKNTFGGLLFTVKGNLHKGTVEILLKYNDTYKISFYKTTGKLRKEIQEAYFDEIQNVIDEVVEKIPEYRF
jgi:hypothetical protein